MTMTQTQPYSVERDFLFSIKSEASYAVTSSLTAGSDYVYVYSCKPKLEGKPTERKLKNAKMMNAQQVPGSVNFSFNVESDYMFSGSAGSSDPIMDAIEAAAGMTKVVSGGASVTYTMGSGSFATGFPSFNSSSFVQCEYRDQIVTGKGCYLNVKKKFVDDLFKIEFDGVGLLSGLSTGNMPSASVTNANDVITSFSSSLCLDGTYYPDVVEFTLDYGNSVKTIPVKTAQYGIGAAWIDERKPSIDMTLIMDSKSNYDFISKAIAQTTASLVFTAFGATDTAGSIHQINAPVVQFDYPSIEEKDGYFVIKVKAMVIGSFNCVTK